MCLFYKRKIAFLNDVCALLYNTVHSKRGLHSPNTISSSLWSPEKNFFVSNYMKSIFRKILLLFLCKRVKFYWIEMPDINQFIVTLTFFYIKIWNLKEKVCLHQTKWKIILPFLWNCFRFFENKWENPMAHRWLKHKMIFLFHFAFCSRWRSNNSTNSSPDKTVW